MERRGLRRGALAGSVLVLVLLGGAGSALRAGDAQVAKVLLRNAKEAFAKKRYEEAVGLLARARTEDPSLAEVLYWIGACREKGGDPVGALSAYREFTRAVSVAGPDAPPPPADVVKNAQARLAALAPGEMELLRLHKAFKSQVEIVGKTQGAADPAVAEWALQTLLRADPEDAEARRRAAAPGSAPPVGLPVPDALEALSGWRDLIADRAFGVYPIWSYEPPGIVMDEKGGNATRAPIPITVGAGCALEMEVSLGVAYHADWAVGFALELTPRRSVGVTLRSKTVVAFQWDDGSTDSLHLGEGRIDRVVPGAWHRLSARVQGNKIEAWVDGRRAFLIAVDGLGPETQVGVYQKLSRVEVRTMRMAPLE